MIETGEIYAGRLPQRQLKVVAGWIKENYEWVLEVFWELNPELK